MRTAKKTVPTLDLFRLAAVLLVVMNHTSPLAAVSAMADFWLTRVLARVAVPFFLMTTGYFLSRNHWAGVGRQLKKLCLLYGVCILLYLPVNLYAGSFTGPADVLRKLLVEGTFTSIPNVVSTFRWGWLPVSPLITQRFESVRKVGEIGSPLLVVHGSEDRLIQPALGRKLYEAAQEPKQFVLVEGGSHHNTNAIGQGQYRQAMASLFRLPTR